MVNYIKMIRIARGITQRTLAKRLEVSRITAWRWETGLKDPTFPQIRKISQLLGTPPASLFPEIAVTPTEEPSRA